MSFMVFHRVIVTDCHFSKDTKGQKLNEDREKHGDNAGWWLASYVSSEWLFPSTLRKNQKRLLRGFFC